MFSVNLCVCLCALSECYCVLLFNFSSEANDLALQIAQSVSGNQHVVSIDGYV